MPLVQNKVIKACAGSGKTHQLIQRLLELLKLGAMPGEILAITFTQKAANEIKSRVYATLNQLAQTETWAQKVQQQILSADNSRDVFNLYTFHAWYASLLINKSRSQNWLGVADLIENDAINREAAWQQWSREHGDTQAVAHLLTFCSPAAIKKLLTQTLVNNSNAWFLFSKPYKDLLEQTTQQLNTNKEQLNQHLEQFCQLNNTQPNLEKLQIAIGQYQQSGELALLQSQLFTRDGKQRANLNKAAAKEEKTSSLLQAIYKSVDKVTGLDDTLNLLQLNIQLAPLLDSYLQIYQQIKTEQNAITFDDLERQVFIESQQNNNINELLYRTQCRYKHILVDEFQDVNPLQWQILRNWLSATIGSESEPSVFIVGDGKQAIYGFRHGDARLLEEADEFLKTNFNAHSYAETTSRRCAPAIIDFVNRVFLQNPNIAFSAHKTAAGVNDKLRGRIEWHKIEKPPKDDPEPTHPRNPLKTPLAQWHKEYDEWATQIAQKITTIVGSWAVDEKEGSRPLTHEDILVLLPQKTHAPILMNALTNHSIPFSLVDSTGQFEKEHFIFKDIIALLSALLSPYNEVSLAQVLRSPIFNFSDEQLLNLRQPQNDAKQLLWFQLLQSNDAQCQAAKKQLQQWQFYLESGRLPLHDLLSTILDEGDFYRRYRASVPASRRLEVNKMLNGILDFVLSYKGGCLPLVQDFLFEINTREAPLSILKGNRGVRIMSIHAAKGLESPVVILADTNFGAKYKGGRTQSIDCLIAWDAKQKTPEMVLFKPTTYFRQGFRQYANSRNKQHEQEDTNLLYVALTRAKQALLIYSLNPSTLSEEIEKQFTPTQILGDDLAQYQPTKEAPAPPPAPLTPTAKIATQKSSYAGEKIHQIIALKLLGLSKDKIATIQKNFTEENDSIAQQIIDNADFQQLLKHSDKTLIEQEFIADGKVIRIDLLIFSTNKIAVVDFKSGSSKHPAYRQQLQLYKAVVAAVYPTHQITTHLLARDGLVAVD